MRITSRLRGVATTVLARTLPDSEGLRHLLALPRFRAFVERARAAPTLPDRDALYAFLEREVWRGAAIDLLEFGVFEGRSLASLCRANTNPNSRFFGFDSFTGNPEPWRKRFAREMPRGAYSTHGEPPRVTDPRVVLVPGFFQDTLPDFLAKTPLRAPLVVHCDANLYSSTLFVLTHCDAALAPGSVLVFDDFRSLLNDFRAFEDWTSSHRRRVELLASVGGAHKPLHRAAFRVL